MPGAWSTKTGLKLEGSGHSTTIGAGNLLRLISGSFEDDSDFIRYKNASMGGGRLSNISKNGNLNIEFHYGDVALAALILGYSNGLASPVVISTGVYHHLFEPDFNLADRNEGIFDSVPTLGTLRRRATVCFDKDSAIYEYAFCFCDKWSFSMSERGIFLELGLRSARFMKDPSWNNSSSSWTEDDSSQIQMDQAKIYLWPRDLFTFSSTVTLSFDEYDAAGSISINIAAGSYLGSELADYIANQFTVNSALGVIYQGNYDYVTRRFSFAGQNPFKVLASGSAYKRIGFNTNTDFGTEHTADCMAIADYIPTISSSDQINVKSLTLNGNNGLIPRKGSLDGYSDKFYSKDSPVITGNIELPRFDSSSIISRLTGRDPFGMKIEFTGESIGLDDSEKFIIFLPSVILSGDNSIPEKGVLSIAADFIAERPTHHDLSNIFKNGSNIYELQGLPTYGTGSENVYGMGVYRDKFYVGSTSGNLYQLALDESAFSDITGSLTGNPGVFKVYKNTLYIGTSTGRIYTYDGTTLSFLIQPEGSVAIADFEIYDGYIYVIFANAEVYRSTGGPSDPWSNIHTGSGTGYRLLSFFGAIYALYNGDVYKSTDGTTFSLEHDFTNTPTGMSIAVHGNVLWIFSDAKAVYDATGSDITAISDLGIDVKHAISFWGHLLLIENATGQDIYALDIKNESENQITSSLTTAPQHKPIIYRKKLFTTGEVTLRYLKPCPEILVGMQNQISSNPLS